MKAEYPISHIAVQELQIDLARRQRVTTLAAQIQARDDEERARQIASNQPYMGIQPPKNNPPSAIPEATPDLRFAHPAELRSEAQRKTQEEVPGDFESQSSSRNASPQAWNPLSVGRRS